MEVPVQEKVNELEDERKKRLQLEEVKVEGKEILAMIKQTEQSNKNELEKLLIWHNVPKRRWETKKK